MKKLLTLVCLFALSSALAGPLGTIRYNWYYNWAYDNPAESQTKSEFNRAYLGYAADLSDQVSAKIVYDVGSKNSAAYAYAKYAWVKVSGIIPKTDLTFGIQSPLSYLSPFKIWGYGYVRNPVTIDYKITSSADVGVTSSTKLIEDLLTLNLGVFNGDGYKNISADGSQPDLMSEILVTPGSLEISLFNAVRKFQDPNSDDDYEPALEYTGALFISYKGEAFRGGVEGTWQINQDGIEGDTAQTYVFAGFAAVPFAEKFEFIARAEHMLTPMTKDEAAAADKFNKVLAVGGVSYLPTPKTKLSLLSFIDKELTEDKDPNIKMGFFTETGF